MARRAHKTLGCDAATAMFIFHRSIAGPLAALTLLAVLIAADAQFDFGATPHTEAIDVAPSEITKFASEVWRCGTSLEGSHRGCTDAAVGSSTAQAISALRAAAVEWAEEPG
jgi:hypothetical protein